MSHKPNRTITISYDGPCDIAVGNAVGKAAGTAIVKKLHITDLHLLQLMVRGSKIEHITVFNELQDELYFLWSDLMSSTSVWRDTTRSTYDDWVVFSRLIGNGSADIESSLRVSDILSVKQSTFADRMSELYTITGIEFYGVFRSLTTIATPPIIIDLGLSRIYEQIVYYEYIYRSPLYSMFNKIRWAVDNEYTQLIEMLDDSYFALYEDTDSVTGSVTEPYRSLYVEYYSYENSYGGHKTSDLRKLLTLHGIAVIDPMHTLDSAQSLINSILTTCCFSNFGVIPLLYRSLDMPYVCTPDTLILWKNTARYIMQLDKSDKDKPDLDGLYASYVMVDLFVQLMENEQTDIMGAISLDLRSRLMYEWLRISAYMLEHDDIQSFNSHPVWRVYARRLELSPMIVEALQCVAADFAMLRYVYYMDHLQMFEILTRRCRFDFVDPSVVEYYPPQIVEYVQKQNTLILRPDARMQMDLRILLSLPDKRIRNVLTIYGITNEINLKPIVSCMSNENIDSTFEDLIVLYVLQTLYDEMGADLERKIRILFSDRAIYSKYSNTYIFSTLCYAFFETIRIYSGDLNPMSDYINYMLNIDEFDRYGPDFDEMYRNLMEFKTYSKYASTIRLLKDRVCDK